MVSIDGNLLTLIVINKEGKGMKKFCVLCFVIAASLFMVASAYTVGEAAVPNPTVTGPIPATAAPGDPSHNYPFFASQFDLAARGYVEEEYFIEGTANRYTIPPL